MKKLPSLLLTLSLTAAAVLSAQTTTPDNPRGPRRGGPGGPGRGPGGHPIVRVLDADRNNEISAAELASASPAIRTLDANNDGTVSVEELRPAHPVRPADAPTPPADARKREGMTRPHPIVPVMLALDANSDGALSSAEITNAPASLAALDANKDGKLTPDELRPLPPTAN